MKRTLKIAGIALLAVILLGIFILIVRPALQRSPAVAQMGSPAAVVARGSIEATISATGIVAAERQVTLAFQSSGPIAEVLIEEGQTAKADQILARLDTSSLERQVARSQASLDTAQARLAQAQQPASGQDLASAHAAVASAQANYDKVKAGPTKDDLAASQAAVDSARANYLKVKAGPAKDDLASARASVDSARAAIRQAQAAYDQVKDRPDVQMLSQALNLQNATIELQRAQANYNAVANRPTKSDLAAAASQLAQAESQLSQLKQRPTPSELAAAAAQVGQAEAQLAQLQQQPRPEDLAVAQAQVNEASVALTQSQAQLNDAAIKAPFEGTVVSTNIEAGGWATPGAPAIVLATTRPLLLSVNADQADVVRIAEGQTARFTLEALPAQEISGTVSHIAPGSTNVSGAVAYGVKIRFDPGQLPARLGMTADVRIVVDQAVNALLAPNRAITADREAGRYYVTRQRSDGTQERVEVRIGLRDDNQTQILEGVNEGDRLVLPEVPAQSQQGGQGGMFGGGGGGGMFQGAGHGGGQ